MNARTVSTLFFVLTLCLSGTTGCGDTSTPAASGVPASPILAVETPPPDYPMEQACAGQGGQTLLSVQIGIEGKPTDIHLIRSSGHDALDQAAIRRVSEWLFKPATRDGKPVAQTIQVPVTFSPKGVRPDGCFLIDEQTAED